MIFDSHCHPQFPQYKNKDEMIKQTLAEGVNMICVGTDLKDSKEGIELANKYKGIWASVGLHPNDNLDEKFDASEYEKLLKEPRVVAVGEIGLDYYRTSEEKDQVFQKNRFIEQLEMAKRNSMPIILHCRDSKAGSTGKAYPQMIEVLKRGYVENSGVVHSYTGNLGEAKQFLDLGLYFGFNGIITFARQYDDVVRYVPLEKILLETDAPFLTPELYRGKMNEPRFVIEVAKKLAELKNESLEKVIEITTKNCQNLFKLND